MIRVITEYKRTASAQIYSLVETAKVNGQEPYTWLRHVLEQLPHAHGGRLRDVVVVELLTGHVTVTGSASGGRCTSWVAYEQTTASLSSAGRDLRHDSVSSSILAIPRPAGSETTGDERSKAQELLRS